MGRARRFWVRSDWVRIAIAQGIAPAAFDSAFIETRRAITAELASSDRIYEPFLVDTILPQFLQIIDQAGVLFSVLEALFDLPVFEPKLGYLDSGIALIPMYLGQQRDPRVEPLLRRFITLPHIGDFARETGASVIIQHVYAGNLEQALFDASKLVGVLAAKTCERTHQIDALIAALRAPTPAVRQIAAWYIGRNHVTAVAPKLITLVQSESDQEALRAAIWSLGVLREPSAIPVLLSLTQNQPPLIMQSAQEALSRIDNFL